MFTDVTITVVCAILSILVLTDVIVATAIALVSVILYYNSNYNYFELESNYQNSFKIFRKSKLFTIFL